jgi:crossover junction endodeoxyribonuclease RuvC
MLILGLDPGLRHTGWGVIRADGNRLSHVADGVVHSDGKAPLAERLVSLFRQLGEILERFRPDEAAVEETFVNKNPASTLKLGVARGVVLLAPAERGVAVAEYSANLIKKSVVGVGHADKVQVQMMVRRLLPGCTLASPDAADALAVAICHAHHAATQRRWVGADALLPSRRAATVR